MPHTKTTFSEFVSAKIAEGLDVKEHGRVRVRLDKARGILRPGGAQEHATNGIAFASSMGRH